MALGTIECLSRTLSGLRGEGRGAPIGRVILQVLGGVPTEPEQFNQDQKFRARARWDPAVLQMAWVRRQGRAAARLSMILSTELQPLGPVACHTTHPNRQAKGAPTLESINYGKHWPFDHLQVPRCLAARKLTVSYQPSFATSLLYPEKARAAR